MHLLMTNIKGLGIHILMGFVSVLLVCLAIILSPIYTSDCMAKLILMGLYLIYLLIYLKFSSCLKLSSHKKQDYLVGLLSFLVGFFLWYLSLRHSSLTGISKETADDWILYYAYIFPSWPFLYSTQNPYLLLLGSLSPAVLLCLGQKLKRYKNKLSHTQK